MCTYTTPKIVGSNLHRCLVLVPNGQDFLAQLLVEGVPVRERTNNTLEILWITHGLNAGIGVSDQVVLEAETSWLLFGDGDFSDLQEEVRNS